MLELLFFCGMAIAAAAKDRRDAKVRIAERERKDRQCTSVHQKQVEFQNHDAMMRYQVQHGYDPRQRVTGRTKFENVEVTVEID